MLMKAQISFEYLLGAVLMLALLGIALTALFHIRSSADDAYARVLFEKDSERFAGVVRQLCLLGAGNSREISLESIVEVQYAAGSLYLSQGPRHTEYEACAIEAGSYSGTFLLENEKGKIKRKG